MRKPEILISLFVATLPIIGALIFLWSDVQTMKATKADYRELAELKTQMVGQLSKNTEAINNLNSLIKQLIGGNNGSNTRSIDGHYPSEDGR